MSTTARRPIRPIARRGLQLASLVIVLAAWEVIGRQNPVFASYPSAIAEAAVRVFVPQLLPAMLTSLHALAVGFAIAAPIGVLLGFGLGRVRAIRVALTPYVNALYVTPRITLIPLLVLWLGIDFELRVVIVVLSAVFPIAITIAAGSKEVGQELTDIGTSFLADRRQRLVTIILPGTLPYVFAGLRLGIAQALTGIIVAEMMAALAGLGQMIILKARALATDELFVPIIAIGIISILLTWLLSVIQRALTPWMNRSTAVS